MKCKDCYARNGEEICLIGKKSRMLVCGHYGCDLQARVVRKELGLKKTQTNADVVEVNHGMWVKDPITVDIGGETVTVDYLVCSRCKHSAPFDEWGIPTYSNYCPQCGAKMDGDLDNNEIVHGSYGR